MMVVTAMPMMMAALMPRDIRMTMIARPASPSHIGPV